MVNGTCVSLLHNQLLSKKISTQLNRKWEIKYPKVDSNKQMRHFKYMLIWIFLVQSVRVAPVFPISPLILTLWTRSSSTLIVLFLPILHPPSLPPPPPVLTQHPTFSLSFYFLPPSLPLSFPWQHLFMAAVAWFKLKTPMIVKTLFHTGQWRTWAHSHTHTGACTHMLGRSRQWHVWTRSTHVCWYLVRP